MIIDFLIISTFLITFACCIVIGCLFFLKAKNKQPSERNYILAIGLFIILFGISRFIKFYFEITLQPMFMWHMTLDEFNSLLDTNPHLELYYDVIWRLYISIRSVGVILLLFELEKLILEKKTKYSFTVIKIITLIPVLIYGYNINETIVFRIIMLVGDFLFLILPAIYLYFSYKTTGQTRRNAFTASASLLLIFIGLAFQSTFMIILAEEFFGLFGLHLTHLFFSMFVTVGVLLYYKSIN